MNKNSFYLILDQSIISLIGVFDKMKKIGIELMRVAEVGATLLELGLQKDSEMILTYEKIIKEQNKIGCWRGISETLFCVNYLTYFQNSEENRKRAIEWILKNQNIDGGFGRFVGDRSRIPVSWRVLETLYLNKIPLNSNIKKTIKWIEKEWAKDMGVGGLSYKCSGVLIANSYYSFFSKEFINNSLIWLLHDQNDDGGWSAKKNSPVGSVPSYTGLALRAILNHSNEPNVKEAIEKGVKWIIKNKTKEGLWREHPVEKAQIQISTFLNKYLKK